MIDVLAAAVGAPRVRTATASDAVHGAVPNAVVAPDSTDACAAALAACTANGWTVEVAGGRTAPNAGRSVERVDVLLSTARLAGVIEYEPDDLTIGVAAGTTMTELRVRVARNRQRVPLDPPSERATVGGVLARGAAGPMRRSWSTPRRQTLGLEVVTGDGRVLRVGGRVVKNVAGYDMNKLFVGSAGTLGVITRAHLRLLPIPEASVVLSLEADLDALLNVARVLIAAAVQPAAVEVTGEPWRLLARYEGSHAALAVAVEQLSAAARALGAKTERADDALARLAVLEADAALVIRVADLPSRLHATIEHARELANGRGIVAAHAGEGIVRIALDGTAATAIDARELAKGIDAARSAMPNGTVLVERAPATVMSVVDPWGPVPEPILKITRELKRQFDPAGILQRGRWLA